MPKSLLCQFVHLEAEAQGTVDLQQAFERFLGSAAEVPETEGSRRAFELAACLEAAAQEQQAFAAGGSVVVAREQQASALPDDTHTSTHLD